MQSSKHVNFYLTSASIVLPWQPNTGCMQLGSATLGNQTQAGCTPLTWPTAACMGGCSAGGGERVGPTDRGGGDVPSIERTERSFLSMEKKGRIIGNLL
jgi:hypothetical protein